MQQPPTETFDVSNYSQTVQTFSQRRKLNDSITLNIGYDEITIKFGGNDGKYKRMIYKKLSNNCFVELQQYCKQCLVPAAHYHEKAISDFVTFFCDKNQTIPSLKIASSSFQYQEHSFFTIFRNTLGKLKRLIKVKCLVIKLEVGQPEVMKILPHLKPGFLKKLEIGSTEEACAKWPRVTQLEQWKKLKSVTIDEMEIPIEKFLHLEYINIPSGLCSDIEVLKKVIQEALNRENNEFSFRFNAESDTEFQPETLKYIDDTATDVPPKTDNGYKYIKVPNKDTAYLKIEYRNDWISMDRCDID